MKFLDGLKALLWSAVGGVFFLLQQILSTMLKQQTGLPESSASFFVFVLIGLQLVKHFRAKPGYYGFDLRPQVKLRRLSAGVAQNERNDFLYFFFVAFYVHAIKRVEIESVFPFFFLFCSRWRRTSCSKELFANLAIWNADHVGTEQLPKKSPDLNSVVLAKYTQQPTSFSGMSFFQSPWWNRTGWLGVITKLLTYSFFQFWGERERERFSNFKVYDIITDDSEM